MKKALALLIAALLLISGTSCANHTAEQQASASSSDPVFQMSQDMKEWLKTANLDASESPKELYNKALEENTLVIYSSSTRMMDVKKSFEKHYPGLTVYVEDFRSFYLIDTLSKDFNKKDYRCDIVFCNNDGIFLQEFLPRGVVFKYAPQDIVTKTLPHSNQAMLPVVIELQQAFYNSEVYDTPPIHSWWELTEEKYRNKDRNARPFKIHLLHGFFQHDPKKQQYHGAILLRSLWKENFTAVRRNSRRSILAHDV